ncbi:MAG: hypothetical protein HQK50_17660 [Oligoflexia bacterium]|nr:hypothetical protein [Oligoflexia bacterium]
MKKLVAQVCVLGLLGVFIVSNLVFAECNWIEARLNTIPGYTDVEWIVADAVLSQQTGSWVIVHRGFLSSSSMVDDLPKVRLCATSQNGGSIVYSWPGGWDTLKDFIKYNDIVTLRK